MTDLIAIVAAPFAFILRTLSQFLDSYGWALIILALLISLIRLPFEMKGKRGTIMQSLLGPRMKEIQEKHKGNPQKVNQEMQKLYQEENFKPFSGCVWQIFPMVILLILFQIIREPLTHLMGLSPEQIELLRTTLEGLPTQYNIHLHGGAFEQVTIAGYIREFFGRLHAVVPEIYNLNMNLWGVIDLGRIPNWQFWTWEDPGLQDVALFMLPVLSAGLLFAQQKVMMALNFMPQGGQNQQMAQMMKTMTFMMPLASLFIGFTFPAAMSIYWISTSLFSTLLNVAFTGRYKRMYEAIKGEMEAKQKEREAEFEARRQETERLRALNATKENKGTSKKKKHLQERERERQRQAAQRQEESPSADVAEGHNPSQEGHRKYARGRAYDPDRFLRSEGEEQHDPDLNLDEIEEIEVDEFEEIPELEDDVQVESSSVDAFSMESLPTAKLPDLDIEPELESDLGGDSAWEDDDDSWDDEEDNR
ncbi:MAG: YidC/Oxa1 family membrane protein insertase [Oscillospiraceae bacterium]|nr:YidC/Oxa1 family membrane protein insertase [Oscillospiraceae bacterium]